MEITFIGLVVIILSIIALIKNENWLLGLIVFFSTFTAAQAIGISALGGALLPYEIPLILWIGVQIFSYIFNPKQLVEVKEALKRNKLFRAIFIFSIISIISIINLAISGVHYEYYDEFHSSYNVIEFSMGNITQFVRIILFLVFSMLLIIKLRSKEQIHNVVKIFCLSTIFAIVWGILQFVLYYLNIPYPYELFNNNEYYKHGYMQVIGGIKRISSIATEPSMFALNLIAFFPLIFVFYIFERKQIESKKHIWYVLLIILTVISIILSTSSTAYISLFVITTLFISYELIKNRKLIKKINFKKIIKKLSVPILIMIVIIAIGTLLLYKFELIEVLKDLTVNKLSTFSGKERLAGEILGLKLLEFSPIIGLGIGSYRTYSMFTNILLNMGILGVCAYLYILYIIIKNLFVNIKKNEKYSLMFLLSIIGMNIAFFISIPDFTYIYYWIILVCSYNYFQTNENIKKDKKELILVNGRFLTQEMTGVQRYATEVVKEFDKLNKQVIVLAPKGINRNEIKYRNIKVLEVGILSGHLWEQLILPLYVIKYMIKYDVKFINLCNVAPMLIPGYVTIHDISFKSNSQHLSFKFVIWYRFITFINIRRYKKIFTVSEFSKSEIIEYYKINPNKVIVTYNAAEHLKNVKHNKDILKKFDLENKKFYFSLGSKSPHKNHIFIEKLALNNPDKTFVVSGNANKVFKGFEDVIEKNLKNLIYTGYINDSEMVSLYKNCEAFIFPSLYEGFGIPPLEAMVAGCKKIILSDIEVFHEIFDDAVIYVDTQNAERLNLEEIKSIENSEKILKKYTWKNTAKKIIDNL